ncbi:Cof-type HAD-IIB family hydrolase [Thermoflavimicrobium dichotomicum]|uniref:Cof subfamily of IIB subfamily of haloacid dehalogenase superfamily/HAD-superfamily hydrolase, subfamily IIB n=1 Tax=Thermoflavimicrobium dichotomicum TaxID=46223 RepID=A0A1I3RMS5_9BACL|nr:Cof-type HAD-IIB family hydrolase [Thermoflavimicrobium dichotomicum]SFJ47605.1 hypothetical protein SAMN05421852_110112 [Thermoflavimicrobium dichotomicum]
MGERYLIACDLDGTLLTGQKTISERTRNVLTTLSALGHKVVIATGRPFHNSIAFYKELQLNTPMINFNGGYVHHPHDPSFPKRIVPIPYPLAKEIIQTAYNHSIANIQVEALNQCYLEMGEDNFSFLSKMTETHCVMGPVLDHLQEDPNCLVFYSPRKEPIDHLCETLMTEYKEEVKFHRWGPPWNAIEVVPQAVNKAIGLKYVAEYLHIPQEKIIAFGDQVNDFEMIEFAGYGIAMGNAIDRLKQLANDVTLTNEEDGIAIYLEKFFKL